MILPLCLSVFLPLCFSAQAPPPPEAVARHFGVVARTSDRVKIVDIGAAMSAAIVSAPDNIRNLDQIRADNQRLADPRALTLEEARRLAATHKAVLAIR